MTTLNDIIKSSVEEHSEAYCGNIIDKLEEIKLKDLLRKANPYQHIIVGNNTVCRLVSSCFDNFVTRSLGTKIGVSVEDIAVDIADFAHNGMKSSSKGIDIDFNHAISGDRYLISAKSGKNWCNADQKKQMKNSFATAKRVLIQGASTSTIKCIEGISYGKDNIINHTTYETMIGKSYWNLIGNDPDTYRLLLNSFSSISDASITAALDYQITKTRDELVSEAITIISKDNVPGALDLDKFFDYTS